MAGIYEIIIRFNKGTGKTSFGLIKDGKDHLNPDIEEIKTYFGITKLVMDKLGVKLKNTMAEQAKS
ncbi:MAG: hypothetical protein EPN22_04375 [Nitrospirae bacterium]|nr:MAG: hypothetical protein EPN22_04375 [Nitrospirota bacterium]